MSGFFTSIGDDAHLAALITAIGADTIGVRAIDGTYTFDATDVFLDVTDGAELESVGVTGNDLTGFEWTADSFTLTTITDVETIAGLVIYIDSGSSATSRMFGLIDRRADSTAISVTGNDNDITVSWPDGLVATL